MIELLNEINEVIDYIKKKQRKIKNHKVYLDLMIKCRDKLLSDSSNDLEFILSAVLVLSDGESESNDFLPVKQNISRIKNKTMELLND